MAPATDTDSPHGHPRGHPQRRRLRDQPICGYRPVAEHIARRFAGRGEPLENLIQVASVGLINALDRFEPTLGSSDDREMLSPLLAQLIPCQRTILTPRFFHELIRRIRRRS